MSKTFANANAFLSASQLTVLYHSLMRVTLTATELKPIT